MTQYRDKMAGSHFHLWNETEPTNSSTGWADALQRYDSAVDRPAGSGRE